MASKFVTGFYARGGDYPPFTIHAAYNDNKELICGRRSIIAPDKSFHWCAAGIYRPYINCGHCLRVLDSARWKEKYPDA